MWKLLEHSEIDKPLWDDFIKSSENASVYALSWWLDVVSPNWKAYVYEVRNEYMFVFPVCWRKKMGLKYVFQPFFTQQLGMYAKLLSDIELEILHDLELKLNKDFKYIEYCMNSSISQLPIYKSLRECNRRNLKLEVLGFNERNRLNSNRKRDLKKASKANVRIQDTSDLESVVKFIVQEKASDLKDLSAKDYLMLEELLKKISEQKRLMLKEVVNEEGALLAVGVFILSFNDLIFLTGTANENGRNLGAMTYMMVEVIQALTDRVKYLDFEGGNVEGVAQFYQGFSPKVFEYTHIARNNLPKIIKWVK